MDETTLSETEKKKLMGKFTTELKKAVAADEKVAETVAKNKKVDIKVNKKKNEPDQGSEVGQIIGDKEVKGKVA